MNVRRQSILYVIGLFLSLGACTEPAEVNPAGVTWLEWPAEALVNAPFAVRVLIPDVECGVIAELAIPVRADTAAVVLEPYYTVLERHDVYCFSPPGLRDTLVVVAGLASLSPRTFALRALSPPFPGEISVPEASPFRPQDFGTFSMLTDSADVTLRDAAGLAAFFTDSLGCQRVAPFPIYSTPTLDHVGPGSYPLDNPDAAIPSYVRYFVTGAVRRAPAPVCGDTLVFHLDSH